MSDTSQLRDRLRDFGFSEKEVDVYLALVERGRVKPKSVASAADISTSYVYEVCERLAERGLVVVEDHQSPTLVRARPPSEAFDDLARRLRRVESAVEQRYRQPSDDGPSLDVVQSRQTVAKRLRALIGDADSEVLLSLPASFLPEVREALRDAVDRGVFVLVALSGDADEVRTGALEDVAVVARQTFEHMPVYLAVDRSRGLISPPAVLSWDHGDEEAIEFTNDTVASTVVGSFFGVWQTAEPMLVRRPNDLPRRYEMIRPAVYDAHLARVRGEAVQVRAEVRPTGSNGETRTVDGRVVDVHQSLFDSSGGDLPFENALVVDTGDERLVVGGVGAFIEDYEATSLMIYAGG